LLRSRFFGQNSKLKALNMYLVKKASLVTLLATMIISGCGGTGTSKLDENLQTAIGLVELAKVRCESPPSQDEEDFPNWCDSLFEQANILEMGRSRCKALAPEDKSDAYCNSSVIKEYMEKDLFIKYRQFGASCGDRVQLLDEMVNCSTQLELIDQEAATLYVPPWNKSLRTLCLVIDETYLGIDEEFTPIGNKIEKYLSKGNTTIDNSADCDATLTVTIRGNALSANYSGAGTLYLGAEVNGMISLEAPGFDTLKQSISGQVNPPKEFSTFEGLPLPDTIRNAPYWDAGAMDICNAITGWFSSNGEPIDCPLW
jgi:hypothetical protein